MKGEIIAVGTELLLGSTVNTNAKYLSQELAELGIDVYYHTVVGDNPERLKKIIDIALKRSDIIFLTGGLGPTKDDLTKEVVCEKLDIKLELDEQVLNSIENYFKKRNKKMSKNNIKQAYIPKQSITLNNDIGTAPGLLIEWNEKKIILLPGPPHEMKTMFENHVKDHIKQNHIIKSKTIKTIGIGESSLEILLKPLIENQTNPTIATYAKTGQVDIKITGKGHNLKEVEKIIEPVVNEVNKLVGKYIYSYDNENIEETLFRMLLDNNMKVSFCESCTGGLMTSRFTKIPGASKVLDRGIVTYSNKSKIEELGVNKETLKRYTAVSKNVALEMATGLLAKTNVDLVISTTGYAGPICQDNEEIGLVFIGLASKNKTHVVECHFTGDRQSIQNRASNRAFNEAREYLITLKD